METAIIETKEQKVAAKRLVKLEQVAAATWNKYKSSEKLGLDFGKAMYELRNELRALGSHKGLGLSKLAQS